MDIANLPRSADEDIEKRQCYVGLLTVAMGNFFTEFELLRKQHIELQRTLGIHGFETLKERSEQHAIDFETILKASINPPINDDLNNNALLHIEVATGGLRRVKGAVIAANNGVASKAQLATGNNRHLLNDRVAHEVETCLATLDSFVKRFAGKEIVRER